MGSARPTARMLLGLSAERPDVTRRVGRPLAGPVRLPPTPAGELARRIRQGRLDRDWSQVELARQMTREGHPWHQTTVAKAELAEREVRFTELLSLAQVLAIPLEHLLGLPAVAESAVVGDLRSKVQHLEREQQYLGLQLQGLERDLAEITAQRDDVSSRLSALKKEVPAAQRAYQAALNG